MALGMVRMLYPSFLRAFFSFRDSAVADFGEAFLRKSETPMVNLPFSRVFRWSMGDEVRMMPVLMVPPRRVTLILSAITMARFGGRKVTLLLPKRDSSSARAIFGWRPRTQRCFCLF